MEKQGNAFFNTGEGCFDCAAPDLLWHRRSSAKRWILGMLCALCLLLQASALAGPAYPGAISFKEQATGETVEIYNHGDEFFSYITDAEGRLLVVDGAGYLRRVVTDGKAYALGGYVTQKSTSRAAGEEVTQESVSQEALQALRNEISAFVPKEASSGDRIGDIPYDYDFTGDAADGRVCIGYVHDYPERESECALLVLHVQFENLSGTFSDQEWHNRIFEGGVPAYFSSVSGGKFTYVPVRETAGTPDDGVVTVTLPFDAPVYAQAWTGQNRWSDIEAGLYRGSDGKNYAIYNTGSVFAYALLQAEDSINFADYDRNGDGAISPTELAVLVVYTGYEAGHTGDEACVGKPAVWAHSWFCNTYIEDGVYTNWHAFSIEVGGKLLHKYTAVGELTNYPEEYDLFTGSGTPQQTQFGLVAHELGHDLGLEDLYASSGAQVSEEIDVLSLMASGGWATTGDDNWEPGASPTYLDPYSRIYLGFYDSETISSDGVYTLYETDASGEYNILRINTDNPDVYYLLENREDTGFDRGMEITYASGDIGGIVIWRIDEEVLRDSWGSGVNDEDGHYGIMPVFAKADFNGIRLPFWSNRIALDAVESLRENGLQVAGISEPAAAMTLKLGTDEASLSIVRQPQDVYVNAGQRAAFSVEAQGENLRYQWYKYDADRYGWWSPISGAEAAQFLTAETTLEDDEATYCCKVYNDESCIYTNIVTLHVSEAPVPPETGDDSTPLVWLCMCLLGGLGLVGHFLRRRGQA